MINIFKTYTVLVTKFSQGVKNCLRSKGYYGPVEVQRSEMLNGVKVAAAKHLGASMAACTIMYQAGSRFECGDYIGASHFLRTMASGPGQGSTAFSKMRVLQQNGAYLTCSSDRQNIAFTLRCTMPVFSNLKYYLLDTAARCCYNDWDIEDRKSLVRGDIYRLTPEQRVIDLIQRALWRGPLANSIFCEEELIAEMSGAKVGCYAKSNFISNCCTVASVGVPFDDVMKLAEKIAPPKDRPPERQSIQSYPRNGFEYCDLGKNHETWIAVAVPGCGTYDLFNLVKHAIVAEACGTGNLQTGQHELDRTLQPPIGLMAGADVFTEYKAFNISYSDTGTFGILAKTRACSAKQVAFGAKEFLTNVGDLNFKQIEVGKKRLKLSLLLHEEDCTKTSEGLALQLANNVQLDSALHAASMIDMICPDEISLTAKSISAKRDKMAVAVVGDVDATPHDQELNT